MSSINHVFSRPNGKISAVRLMSPALKRVMLFVLVSLVACLRPAAAMQPCPSQDERYLKAQIVVEARAKSFLIDESGLLTSEGMPTRMTRTVLEIKKVIKGDFTAMEATLYGGTLLPGPVRELAAMATVFGIGGDDIFKIELFRHKMDDSGITFFSLNNCIYYKFPDFATVRE